MVSFDHGIFGVWCGEGKERAAATTTMNIAQYHDPKQFRRKNRNFSPSQSKMKEAEMTSPQRRSHREKIRTSFYGLENNTQKSSTTKGKRKMSGDNIAGHPTSKEKDTFFSLPLNQTALPSTLPHSSKSHEESSDDEATNDSHSLQEYMFLKVEGKKGNLITLITIAKDMIVENVMTDKSQSSSRESGEYTSSDDDDDNPNKKKVTEMINVTSREWKNETSITSMFAKLAVTCTMQTINPSNYSDEDREFVHTKFDKMRKCFQFLLNDKLAKVNQFTNKELVCMKVERLIASEENVQKTLKTRFCELKSNSKNDMKKKLKTETSTSSSNDIVTLLTTQISTYVS